NDAIERHRDGFEIRIENLESEIGRCHGPRNGDLDLSQILGSQRSGRHHHWTVALAHAAPATHQRVVVLQVRVGVEADGRYVKESLVLRAPVQGLDVAQGVVETIAGY